MIYYKGLRCDFISDKWNLGEIQQQFYHRIDFEFSGNSGEGSFGDKTEHYYSMPYFCYLFYGAAGEQSNWGIVVIDIPYDIAILLWLTFEHLFWKRVKKNYFWGNPSLIIATECVSY